MHYYKATLQYDGTGYFGFQWQKGIPTIQNDVNIALAKLIAGKVTTMSASRTDSGVHAMEQVVKITTEGPIELSTFVKDFNQALPSQIRCLDISPSEQKFRPANDHHTKVYHYYFTNKRIVPIEDKRFVGNFPKELNLSEMQFCINAIPGTNDFKNFCSAGSNVKSTIRTITICELSEVDPRLVLSRSELFKLPDELTTCYRLKVEGNGFLKQMIRHIVSGLWMVGSGKLSREEFMALLHGEKRDKRIWKVAPPNGLFLIDIRY